MGGDKILGATSTTTEFRGRGMKGQKKKENVLHIFYEHVLEFQDCMEVVAEKNPKIWPLETLRWWQGSFIIRDTTAWVTSLFC